MCISLSIVKGRQIRSIEGFKSSGVDEGTSSLVYLVRVRLGGGYQIHLCRYRNQGQWKAQDLYA